MSLHQQLLAPETLAETDADAPSFVRHRDDAVTVWECEDVPVQDTHEDAYSGWKRTFESVETAHVVCLSPPLLG